MRKLFFLVVISLSICMVGCTNEEDNNVNSEIIYKSENTGQPTDMNIDEEIDVNLYVEAKFHMPEEQIFSYSSELKQFDYDKVQSIIWPDVSANEITTDEFGMRYYGESSFGGENGFLIYRVKDDINYIDTLCSYAKEKRMIPEKDLEFATIEKAKSEVEEFISKFDIGCEMGNPYIITVDSEDLTKVQEAIMKDEEYSDILNRKKLGDNDFGNNTEVYYFEYSFMINNIQVFGHEDPMIQYSGDTPLLAQSMRVKIIMSDAGIQMFSMEGVLDKLTKNHNEAEIIGYEGIKKSLEKKFGDVILTDEYKVTNVWMEYFPLIKSDSFEEVEVIPVWCCDFEINGEVIDYTLRFNAFTGEEIS